MTQRFNRPEIALALNRFLRIQGGVLDPVFGETITPTFNIGDLLDSPYLEYGIHACGSLGAAPVVAERGYVWVSPGRNVLLQVRRIVIRNENAGAHLVDTKLFSAANIAAIGTVSTQKLIQVTGALESGVDLRSSFLASGTDAANTGQSLESYTIPANSHVVIDFPEPGITLRGDDAGGVPGFGMRTGTPNELISMAVFAREWPLPG